MALNETKMIDWDQGWEFVHGGITKLKHILELEGPNAQPSSEDYMMLYTTTYNMCTQRLDHSERLYDRYRKLFEEHITSTVLPSLVNTHNELLLYKLVKMWLNYKVMDKWLSSIFHYLDCYYIKRRMLPSLHEVAISCFYNQVFSLLNDEIKCAVISLINHERDGELNDHDLLKNVMGVISETRLAFTNSYEEEFERAILEGTAAYYSQKAFEWIFKYPLEDYLLKVEECLKSERRRLSHYNIYGSENSRSRLLQVVRQQLMSVCEKQLKNHLSHQKAINQELVSMCDGLTLDDGNSNDASCRDMQE